MPFNRRRKTEPKFVFVLRGCVMILLMVFLVAYTVFLIIGVIDSGHAPVIQISERFDDKIPFPGGYKRSEIVL